jgi:hypothetical protein
VVVHPPASGTYPQERRYGAPYSALLDVADLQLRLLEYLWCTYQARVVEGRVWRSGRDGLAVAGLVTGRDGPTVAGRAGPPMGVRTVVGKGWVVVVASAFC